MRFIYVRPIEYYLRLDKTRDVIEWQLDDTLDINGWDIHKALCLLHKSNPTLFEWNNSPIVYKTTPEWERLSSVIEDYFGPKSAMYHYLSIAKSNFRKYIGESTVKYKKYFYMLRPILACEWIEKEGTPPPVRFEKLMENCLDKEIEADVLRLLNLKINMPEIATGAPFECLNAYLERKIAYFDGILEAMPSDKKQKWDELNGIFLSLVKP